MKVDAVIFITYELRKYVKRRRQTIADLKSAKQQAKRKAKKGPQKPAYMNQNHTASRHRKTIVGPVPQP